MPHECLPMLCLYDYSDTLLTISTLLAALVLEAFNNASIYIETPFRYNYIIPLQM
jgi:hypothetical protein